MSIRQRAHRWVTAIAVLVAMMSLPANSAAQEEHAARYVPAITSPYFNETPFITTEARALYLHTETPEGFFLEGDVDVWSMQLRYAVNERIGIIVTQLGYADFHTAGFLPDTDGLTNLALGAKYAVIAEPATQTFLTLGGTYEAPVGGLDIGMVDVEGGGSGLFDLFASFGSTVGAKTGFEASAGFNVALDPDHDTTAFHCSAHVDHEVSERLFAVLEANVLTSIAAGKRTVGTAEGYDLFNFGSTGAGTVASLAFGARFRVNDHLILGAAYELPVSGNEDIIDSRFMFDAVLHL